MDLSPADWAKVEELLPEVLALPSSERKAFLARSGISAAVRDEVQSLLEAAETPGGVLARPAAVTSDSAAPEMLPAGTILGAWRIGEPIGHGGMGSVYGAERADGQFEMPAAIKVLRRGLDTDDLLRRFRRERSILARLSHPNIARIVDAGATTDGRPYYVMERIQGLPITRHCEAKAASISEILGLMRQVCEAVGAAHSSLIVHRDLKPSNVLVTGQGEVRLLDFGVAKILPEDEQEDSHTSISARMLTPAYAAPEQLLGEPVSTATDVYSMGVMLFRLLTGHLPHRREGLLFAADVRRETTRRPSIALRQARKPTIAQRRRLRELEGDIDMIVLKAMHFEPQRRYRSAFELADDLQRFLEHRPVLASPESLGYRLKRFGQRYPVPVAAGVVAVLALIVGFGVALWQAQVAIAARDDARRAAAIATAVSEFLNKDLLQQADPRQGVTRDLTVGKLLDRASSTVAERFKDQPEVAARVHATIGEAYQQLREVDLARTNLERAVELYASSRGPMAPETIGVRWLLTRALRAAGKFKESCAMIAELRQQLEQVLPAEDDQRLLLRTAGTVCLPSMEARKQASAEIAAIVLELERRKLTDDELYATALRNLGSVAFDRYELAEAERHFRKLLEFHKRTHGEHHYVTARARAILANTLTLTGQLDEADRELAMASTDQRAWTDQSAGDSMLTIVVGEAILRLEQGRFAEATVLARRCLDSPLGRQQRGYFQLAGLYVLAESLLARGKLEDARRAAEESVSISRELGIPKAHHELQARAAWADVLIQRNKLDEAAAVLAAITDGDLAGLSEHSPMYAPFRRSQGLLWLKQGRLDQAKAALQESLDIYQLRYGPDHWRTHRAQRELAKLAPQA